ncbi:MAG TPA: hypothetical protein DIW23_05735 [Anaerolineae bacterium]|nr:hypothetical protein [Anaerolineae bacterium]
MLDIPEKASNAFQGNMQNGGAVELPFPAPSFFIVNGNAQLQQVGGIHYFGGFACAKTKLQEAAESWENVVYPVPGLYETEKILESGEKLPVFASRNLTVAMIGMRLFATLKSDGKTRVPAFSKEAIPGIQVVCLLGYKNENKEILPWAPIMISASGYQVNNVRDAFIKWFKAIKPTVKKLAPNQEPSNITNLFWMSIGTFGETRVQKPAGQKFITPVSSFIPDVLDEDVVKSRYVGNEIASLMADFATDAKEWLHVFDKDKFTGPTSPQGFTEPAEDPHWDSQEQPPEDDIPF